MVEADTIVTSRQMERTELGGRIEGRLRLLISGFGGTGWLPEMCVGGV